MAMFAPNIVAVCTYADYPRAVAYLFASLLFTDKIETKLALHT